MYSSESEFHMNDNSSYDLICFDHFLFTCWQKRFSEFNWILKVCSSTWCEIKKKKKKLSTVCVQAYRLVSTTGFLKITMKRYESRNLYWSKSELRIWQVIKKSEIFFRISANIFPVSENDNEMMNNVIRKLVYFEKVRWFNPIVGVGSSVFHTSTTRFEDYNHFFMLRFSNWCSNQIQWIIERTNKMEIQNFALNLPPFFELMPLKWIERIIFHIFRERNNYFQNENDQRKRFFWR